MRDGLSRNDESVSTPSDAARLLFFHFLLPSPTLLLLLYFYTTFFLSFFKLFFSFLFTPSFFFWVSFCSVIHLFNIYMYIHFFIILDAVRAC